MLNLSFDDMEHIVVSIIVIHVEHLQDFFARFTYLLYYSLFNVFEVKCPLRCKIADRVHVPGTNPGRSSCLGFYFSASFRSVNYTNKIIV